jgi:FtsP/CotA-like multicopper oxidase with cupredoxin domain
VATGKHPFAAASTRRQFIKAGAALGAIAFIPGQESLISASRVFASTQFPQTPLPGANIPKYVTPLHTFVGHRVTATSYTNRMVEFQQQVLPPSFKPTWLWGYQINALRPSWPGVTIEARRGSPTTVTYVNRLPLAVGRSHVEKLLTIDQTLHWADPLNAGNSFKPYTGPMPGVVHLHGAEVPSAYDGVPEAWFTANGIRGRGFRTLVPTVRGAAVYRYPNPQPAATLWFHDHTLGITRINVFSGLAAFYFVRDEFDTGKPDNPLRLPAGSQEVELMVQDRFFDTNGQLRFPDGSNTAADLNGPPTNPSAHPFWIPEFFGDTMCVNGRTWPFLKVEPRRYRLRFVDGCNARFLRMNLTMAANASSTTPPSAVAFWQIGTDGGFLDSPVMLNKPGDPNALKLFLAPSERADVIIDFAGLEGKTLTLTNDGIFPFPSGGPPDPNLDGQIMQFQVVLPLSSKDETFDPSAGGSLRGGRGQEAAIVRLTNPAKGTIEPGVKVTTKRQLVLFEQDTFADVTTTPNGPVNNGPLMDMINNTRWKGLRDGTNTPVPGSRPDPAGQGLHVTELPQVGSTELWELVDTTPDSHPIHIHLIQFQILNRQSMDITNYSQRLQHAQRRRRDRGKPGGEPAPQRSGRAARPERGGLEGQLQGPARDGEPHSGPLGADRGVRGRRRGRGEQVRVRPHRRPRLRRALSHPRPRGPGDDEALRAREVRTAAPLAR